MKKYLFPLLFTMFFGVSLQTFSQRSGSAATYSREASSIVSKYKRELTQIRNNTAETATDSSELSMSPYYYKLFGPGVFFRSVLDGKLKLNYSLPDETDTSLQTTDALHERQRINGSIDRLLMGAYVEHPDHFHYSDAQIAAETTVSPTSSVETKVENLASIYDKVDEIKDVADVLDSVEVDLQIVKPIEL